MMDIYLVGIKNKLCKLKDVPRARRTEEICLEAVRQDGYALLYVPNSVQTEEICLESVKQNCDALVYVPEDKRTKEVYLGEVKQNWMVLESVPVNQRTEEMCLEAAIFIFSPVKGLCPSLAALSFTSNVPKPIS